MPSIHRLALCILVLAACGPAPAAMTGPGSSETGTNASADATATTDSTATTDTPTTQPSPTTTDTTLATTSPVTLATSTADDTTQDPGSTVAATDTTATEATITDTTLGAEDTNTTAGSSDTGEGCAVVDSLLVDADTDLEALGCIEEVLGDAEIGPTQLTSLAVLKNLRKVGGHLTIRQNHQLVDLTGLDALETVGGWFRVFGNDGLVTMAGLPKVSSVGGYIVAHNAALTALSPLAGAVTLTAPGDVIFGDLPQLKDLDDLSGLKLSGAAPRIEVDHNPALTSLAGLGACCSGPNASLQIHSNVALPSLVGLESFTTLQTLLLVGNDALKDLTGLGGLKEVTMMIVGDECYFGKSEVGNASLVSLAGLGELATVEVLRIVANPKLPEALAHKFADDLTNMPFSMICANLDGVQCENNGPCPQ